MKNSFLALVLLVVPFLAKADNWDLFPPNQVTYYHFTSENMDAISPFYVDAVETVNDTEYQYILRAYMENISGGCYETLTTNDLWNETNYRFPNEVMVKQNGWYGETVFEVNPASPPSMIFNVLANVGDKWLIESETYQDFDQIEVECVSMESENFLDVADNVKTFHLQALQNGTPVSSNFNDIVLKISEQYGLISGIPLKELRQNAPTTQMQLVGFEDENGDLHGRGAYTILDFVPDFQVGDILKWYYSNYGVIHHFENYHRDSITSVEVTDTSISYRFDRTSKEIQTVKFNGTVDSIRFYTAFNQIQTYSSNLYAVPLDLNYYGQIISNDFLHNSIWYVQNSTQHLYSFSLSFSNNMFLRVGFSEIINGENCEINYYFGHNSPDYYFHPKVGLVKFIVGMSSENLIGYRIGNEEGGDIEPIITNIESPIYFAQQITLHPNPTNNRFVLQLQNPKLQNLQLTITDIHGRTLQHTPLLQSSIEVDLSEQPNGIYLVQISDGKSWWTEKVVKY